MARTSRFLVPLRRGPRFGLLTLLVLVAVLGAILAPVAREIHRARGRIKLRRKYKAEEDTLMYRCLVQTSRPALCPAGCDLSWATATLPTSAQSASESCRGRRIWICSARSETHTAEARRRLGDRCRTEQAGWARPTWRVVSQSNQRQRPRHGVAYDVAAPAEPVVENVSDYGCRRPSRACRWRTRVSPTPELANLCGCAHFAISDFVAPK